MMNVVKALGCLVMWPVAGFLGSLVLTFALHWFSGEGEVHDSGQPWIMIGAMLFTPTLTFAGLVAGVVTMTNVLATGSMWPGDSIRLHEESPE